MAHFHGATLLFNSVDDKMRQLLANYAFKSNTFSAMVIDHMKPIAVIAGEDTFSQISCGLDYKDIGMRQLAFEELYSIYYRCFSIGNIANTNLLQLNLYPEKEIDLVLAEKE
jgi:hypothetical protein